MHFFHYTIVSDGDNNVVDVKREKKTELQKNDGDVDDDDNVEVGDLHVDVKSQKHFQRFKFAFYFFHVHSNVQ